MWDAFATLGLMVFGAFSGLVMLLAWIIAGNVYGSIKGFRRLYRYTDEPMPNVFKLFYWSFSSGHWLGMGGESYVVNGWERFPVDGRKPVPDMCSDE